VSFTFDSPFPSRPHSIVRDSSLTFGLSLSSFTFVSPPSSIFSHVPTEAQLTLHLLRQRELVNNPLPRPPNSITSVEAQEKLNDTSPMSNAHEQDTTSSVGDGDESHLVGDGDHDEEGKGPSKLKSTVLGLGKKLAAKGATFRGAGKVEVLPEGVKKPVSSLSSFLGTTNREERDLTRLNFDFRQKRSTKTKLTQFVLNRSELKDDGSIWGKLPFFLLLPSPQFSPFPPSISSRPNPS